MPAKRSLLFFILNLCVFASVIANEAKFRYENHCLNNLIYFEDLSTAKSTIISWFWKFGDEAVSMDQNPIHTYTESGTYQVELTIQTDDGTSFSTTEKINIVAPPFAFFDPNEKCDNTVVFSDNSFTRASEVKLWMWDFGDGNYSLEKNPIHKFQKNEPQKVGLKIIDHNGCGDSISQTIHLKKLPKTGFDIKHVNLENTAFIKIESANKTDSVFYLINNKLIQTKSTIINVPESKSVNIKQQVIDKVGCTDSIQRIVYAGSDYYLSVSPTFEIRSSDSLNQFGVSNSNVNISNFKIKDTFGVTYFDATKNNKNWNGIDKQGNIAKQGIYYYTISFETAEGVKALQKGKFSVTHKEQ